MPIPLPSASPLYPLPRTLNEHCGHSLPAPWTPSLPALARLRRVQGVIVAQVAQVEGQRVLVRVPHAPLLASPEQEVRRGNPVLRVPEVARAELGQGVRPIHAAPHRGPAEGNLSHRHRA